MLEEPDAEAEKVRRRKDRKRAKQYREAIAKGDWKSVATIHIQGKGFHEKSVSEDCPECLALVRGAA